jgi:mannosyltransferase OCH1-like enzyme
MDNFGQAHVNCFDNLIPYAYKADFMRYCIIYNEGGWYSDWQQILLVPLSKFNGYSWVSCWDTTGDENRINGCMQNGFFGACKNNNILKECINKCIDNYSQKNYGKSPWYPTGPCLLGDAFRKINPSRNIKLGFTQTDPVDGPCFVIDSVKTIINKCCSDINKPGSEFKNGNNYYTLWTNKSIYK